jgi:hypothetical protein
VKAVKTKVKMREVTKTKTKTRTKAKTHDQIIAAGHRQKSKSTAALGARGTALKSTVLGDGIMPIRQSQGGNVSATDPEGNMPVVRSRVRDVLLQLLDTEQMAREEYIGALTKIRSDLDAMIKAAVAEEAEETGDVRSDDEKASLADIWRRHAVVEEASAVIRSGDQEAKEVNDVDRSGLEEAREVSGVGRSGDEEAQEKAKESSAFVWSDGNVRTRDEEAARAHFVWNDDGGLGDPTSD